MLSSKSNFVDYERKNKKISFLFNTRKADQGVGCTSVLFPETELLLLKSTCAESIIFTSRGCVNASLSHNDFYKIAMMASVYQFLCEVIVAATWNLSLLNLVARPTNHVLAASLIAMTKSTNEGTTQKEIFWLIIYVESVYANTVQCVLYGTVAVVRQLVTLHVQSGSREN